ncbi:MAG: DegT/DnrJ/EryC1/StrS family aminotransferase [Candidatus Omnitrophica bacterium]|nr:DegT/DnrJ/EryC1/StrS family aminotransferase [Candidatus Omnitrophota bacterium]
MNELQGALGLVQLQKLDQVISRQRANKQAIKEGIKDIAGLTFRPHHDPSGEIATFLLLFLPTKEKTEKFKAAMAENGVTPGVLGYWHFTANVESWGGSFPKTEALLGRMIVVEIQAVMSERRLDQVITAIRKAARIL